jgi:ABC-type bacteriocin/lantibiotic exporter with double-glycine peptidase domain
LVIDEVSSQLNRALELRILERLKESCRSRCTIIVTHSADVILACDRVAVIDSGQLVRVAHPSEIEDGKRNSL